MTEKNYKSILQRLIGVRNAAATRRGLEGAIDFIAYIAGVVFLLWLITGVFWPAPGARISILLIVLAGAATILGFVVVKPMVVKKPLTHVALKLEKYYGKLQSRLIGSLQLYDKLSNNKENYSIELIEKTIEDAGAEIKDLNFGVVVERSKSPYYRLMLGVALIILAIAISGGTMYHTANLFANPLTDIPKPTNLVLTVTPQNYQAVKNDDITVQIVAAGERVRQVNLNFKYDDGEWVKVAAEKTESDTADGMFSYTFRKLKRDVEYYAEAKRVQSPKGKITIVDPPRLLDVAISLDYPKYTGIGTQKLPGNDGSVTALKGTIVNFEGRANKTVVDANLVFKNGEEKRIEIDDDIVTGKFVVSASGSYHVRLADADGLSNPNPIEYDIVSLEDYPPQVQITFPAVDVDLDDRMLLPLEAALFDDYGFSKLDLVYWTYSEGRESDKQRRKIKTDFGKSTEALATYEWWVEELYLLPGDLIYYYLEVFDNDVISGPKSSVSKTYTARLPSLDEIMADITGTQDEIFHDFEETVQNQRELRDELENISRELRQYTELDWEKKQQIQSTLDRQKDIAEKLEDMTQKMDEMIEKFERNQMATTEMMQKMEELRELFEEVATPELKEAMKKLQEALEKMDPKLLEEAMKNFQMSVEQINENLDRMMALLKKYQLEQKLDTLAKMSEKLAEQQQEINDKLGQCQNKSDFSNLEKPQQNQQQGLESLKEQFKEAQELNEQLNMVPQEQMQNADNKLNSQQLQEMMEKMMQAMGQCSKGQCQKSGQQLQQEFQEMAQMFQQMLQQMQMQQLAMITGMIKKAINDVLFLSHTQENLKDSTGTAEARRKNTRELAREQNNLKSACERVANNVTDITRETLFVNAAIMERLGRALTKMQEAIEQLNSRSPQRSSSCQSESMSALNQAAAILMSALQQASQCNSSGTGMQSLMQKLSQMAQQQQQLNQNSQNMMPMPMPNMMSMAQQQAMQRLAAQQEEIRKGLRQLMEEYGNPDNVLGRLDNIESEMKKVVDEMQDNRLDRETINRQERILSRLLDAQRSVHRRDYSRQRQARSGQDVIRRGPSDINLGNFDNEKLAEDIKKALSEKYPRRYESEIREYFRALTEDQASE